ncbi:MAG: hypothetical protein IJW81_06775, partial [Clostridia bacterium]|nr:hypothetical protein [Clostridia bacterium]
MKKTLSLILAALLCAAMTPAVMAEEAVVDEAIVEEPAVVEEAAAEEAVAEEDTVVEELIVAVDVNAVVALAAEYGLELTPEVVTLILNSGIEITAENLKLYAATLNIELPEEFITALIELIANTPAPIAEVAVEEVVAEEA